MYVKKLKSLSGAVVIYMMRDKIFLILCRNSSKRLAKTNTRLRLGVVVWPVWTPFLCYLTDVLLVTCKWHHDTTQLMFISSTWIVMATGQTSNERHLFCTD